MKARKKKRKKKKKKKKRKKKRRKKQPASCLATQHKNAAQREREHHVGVRFGVHKTGINPRVSPPPAPAPTHPHTAARAGM